MKSLKIVAIIAASLLAGSVTMANAAETELFYSPGACSLASHIVAKELGLNIKITQVDLKTHKTQDGRDYYKIIDGGKVPAVQEGEFVLSEGVAVLQYLADKDDKHRLIAPPGDNARYRVLEALNMMAMDVHHNLAILLKNKFRNLGMSTKAIEIVKSDLKKSLSAIDKSMEGKSYMLGQLSIADMYLFNMLTYLAYVDMDLKEWNNLSGFLDRMSQMESVKAAITAESSKK